MKATLEFDLDNAQDRKIYFDTIGKMNVGSQGNIDKANRVLANAIGDSSPMSKKERAQKAANARWEKQRLAKDAKEREMADFKIEEHEEISDDNIDGRQILEGKF